MNRRKRAAAQIAAKRMTTGQGPVPLRRSKRIATSAAPTAPAAQQPALPPPTAASNGNKQGFPLPIMRDPKFKPDKTLSMLVYGSRAGIASTFHAALHFMVVFICQVTNGCSEAVNGQKHGSRQRPKDSLPCIPSRKYTVEHDHYNQNKNWIIQALYEIENVRGRYVVSYEGWDSKSMDTKTVPPCDASELSLTRSGFLDALSKRSKPEVQGLIARLRYLCDAFRKNPLHWFWAYEDLTYFHSAAQDKRSDGPVFYFSLTTRMVEPPQYYYSAVNVVHAEALKECIGKPANKPFDKIKTKDWKKRDKKRNGACENAAQCKCNTRFAILYEAKKGEEQVKNLQVIKGTDGILNMKGVKRSDLKVSIECTEECGCTLDCPRRRVQRGQTKALAVVYENSKTKNCLMAMEPIKKGEFICEYIGYCCTEDSQRIAPKDSTYEMDCRVLDAGKFVIDAKHVGNVARFANHHCSPNSIFLEVESRRTTSEPLIPRVTIYATQDIAVGEHITVAYCETKPPNPYSTVPCLCGAVECMKYFLTD